MKLNKNTMHITIETEACSNGEAVARSLSEMLNIPCYGEEILDKAAQLSGIPASQLHRYDGRSVRAAYDLLADDKTPLKMRPASDFVAAQIAACQALASQGACILVDRHSGQALEGSPDHVRIFIHAGFDDRAANLAAKEGKTVEEAKHMLKKLDRSYRSYYRGSDRGWGEADRYDLSLNASDADVNALTANVMEFLSAMCGEIKQTVGQRKAV